jgi:hypothetical protein
MYRSTRLTQTGTLLDSESNPQLKDMVQGETVEQRENHRTQRYWFKDQSDDNLNGIEVYADDELRPNTLPRHYATSQGAKCLTPIIRANSNRNITQVPQGTYIAAQTPIYTPATTPKHTTAGTVPNTPMSILKHTQPQVIFSGPQLV